MNKNNADSANGNLPPEMNKVPPKCPSTTPIKETKQKQQMPPAVPSLPAMMPNMPKIPGMMPDMSKMSGMPKMMSGMPKIPPGMDMKNASIMDNNAIAGMMHAKMMTAYDGFSGPCTQALARAFDLSTHREVVDLGGK